MPRTFWLSLFFLMPAAWGKEIAFTFDDAPVISSKHFSSLARSNALIQTLGKYNVPPVMVFANPCKAADSVAQLDLYRKAKHLIGNHSCSHPRFEEVGLEAFTKDVLRADQQLKALFGSQKFFRFPYLNEHNQAPQRDQFRSWLKQHGYRNAPVSVDNDDYLFSAKINQARRRGRKIDYAKVEAKFLAHVLGALEFYDDLAVKTLGRSLKHVLLLHEVDATVMFLGSLITALRERGWTIIGVEEAYTDEIYFQNPAHTYANNGIIAQLAAQLTGERKGYNHFHTLSTELDVLLGIGAGK